VSEYIEEENQGIQNLTRKRGAVENEADEVGSLINTLRGKLSGIDSVVSAEGEKIKDFKESRRES
ncbi:MAG TPA: transcriptional regulator, partial [Nitrosopumilaceae archaeon]